MLVRVLWLYRVVRLVRVVRLWLGHHWGSETPLGMEEMEVEKRIWIPQEPLQWGDLSAGKSPSLAAGEECWNGRSRIPRTKCTHLNIWCIDFFLSRKKFSEKKTSRNGLAISWLKGGLVVAFKDRLCNLDIDDFAVSWEFYGHPLVCQGIVPHDIGLIGGRDVDCLLFIWLIKTK